MIHERHVKLFRNGRNQAVRIPRDFELPGDDAIMRKEGNRLVIVPREMRSFNEVLDHLETLEPLAPDEQMPMIERLYAEPVTCFDQFPDD